MDRDEYLRRMAQGFNKKTNQPQDDDEDSQKIPRENMDTESAVEQGQKMAALQKNMNPDQREQINQAQDEASRLERLYGINSSGESLSPEQASQARQMQAKLDANRAAAMQSPSMMGSLQQKLTNPELGSADMQMSRQIKFDALRKKLGGY